MILRLWNMLRNRVWPSVAAVLPYIGEAEQVVRWLEGLAGQKDWNGVRNALDRLGDVLHVIEEAEVLRREAEQAATPKEALFVIACGLLRKKYPEVAERRLRRAVELAYGILNP